MDKDKAETCGPLPGHEGAELLRLRIDEDLYRAFQRCVWLIIHETDRDRTDIHNEMVRDFLVKHQC